jgi:hypothetical protein
VSSVLSDSLYRFAAHRLGVEIMDAWMMVPEGLPGDTDFQKENPEVTVFVSHFDRIKGRQVSFFKIRYRELRESLMTFASVSD